LVSDNSLVFSDLRITCMKKDLAETIVGREVGDKEANVGDVEQGVLRQNQQIRSLRLIRI